MKEYFKEYKEITLDIIKAIKDDKEDVELIKKREEILKEIFSQNISIDELKQSYESMNLNDLDIELGKVLQEKISDVKFQIKEMGKVGRANNVYGGFAKDLHFFSKKI